MYPLWIYSSLLLESHKQHQTYKQQQTNKTKSSTQYNTLIKQTNQTTQQKQWTIEGYNDDINCYKWYFYFPN